MSGVEAEAAIIGGGLIGCLTAWRLSQRGCSAIVLERGVVGAQSSGVSFGSLRLQGHSAEELPLALRAQEIWEGIEKELGESLEFEQRGHVHLALCADHVGRLERNAVAARAAGLSIDLMDGGESRRRWPFLSESILAASFSGRDATVNPRRVAPAFARAATRSGAGIREQVEVFSCERATDRFTLRCRAPQGDFTARSQFLINAAGAWGGALAAQFGETIPIFAAGPVEIVTEPAPAFVEPVMHVVDGSVLFRQTNRGNVIIGGHPRVSVDAESRRARPPPEKIAVNLARLIAVAPRMRAHHAIRSWTGIEGYLPDMQPALGASATTPGLFHACGFSGHGLQLGPAAAEILCDLIIDGATKATIAALRPDRFRAAEEKPARDLAEDFFDNVLKGGKGAL